MTIRWSRRLLLAVFVVVGVVGSIQIAARGHHPGTAATAPGPAQVTFTPGPDAHDVDPVAPVMVKAEVGTLAGVDMVNEAGTSVQGVMTPDNLVWKPTVPLGYGRTYTLTVTSRGTNGVAAKQVSTFTTLRPSNQTKVSFTTTAEAPLRDGGTYGVGTVIVAHFDEQIADRAAAERRLAVTTTPKVQGSWFWVDGQNAHWRPEHYYAPGTQITAEAQIYGIALGDGLFGQTDSRVSFRIGDAHVSIADDATKQVSVFNNGALVRTMPTSMGMGGTEDVGGRKISLWTPPGVYTVLDKGNPVVMDSSTFGLPKNSRLGYRETINYATKISTDGIYLHELEATVWAQGHRDTSHGCLNLNADNAKWFYDFSVPGDVVEVRNSGGPPLALEQNGDWTLSWDQWREGSALKPT
ncbi:L,D-transpeptidase family protein [Mycobacterium sp. WUMAC-067]|uniref:L,D-transpeptidase n=1 Tax=unclassified Mycobacterium TaxID=2642494 RepID=UPI001CD9EEAA|nr:MULTISPECIES: Ig-like domain-containing protein [unclassified Mycobacterium]MCA2244806.1 L,D-transpeptidase family protein [Mycobacterium sp. WUMAC-067]MCA2316138.1 L,D-transpeptidase family protein [Mycobacterium sp. WUMAC-025]